MSEDELDDEEEPELDEEAFDEGALEPDVEDEDALDSDVDVADEVDDTVAVAEPVQEQEPAEAVEEDDDVLDLDEELHPDDVEEPLDVLLQERTASASLEDEEEELEEEEADVDDRGEAPTRIVPRRPGEFLCSSCFLVLPRSQLADSDKMLCRDCA